MDIEDKVKKHLLDCYKAYFKEASEMNKDNNLTEEEVNAVAQHVLDGLMGKAFERLKISAEERIYLKFEFDKLFREEYPEMLFQTSFKFDPDKGFTKKNN